MAVEKEKASEQVKSAIYLRMVGPRCMIQWRSPLKNMVSSGV